MSDVTKENTNPGTISLEDIMNDNSAPNTQAPENQSSSDKYAPVNPSAIRPAMDINKDKKDAEKQAMHEILDNGVGRKITQMRETAEKFKQEIYDDMIEHVIEGNLVDPDDPKATKIIDVDPQAAEEAELLSESAEDIKKQVFEDPDIAELEKELEEDIEQAGRSSTSNIMNEDNIEALSEDIKRFIKPVTNVIDLSQFKISSNAMPGAQAITTVARTVNKSFTTADWVLVDTGRLITMRSFDTDVIEKLDKLTIGRASSNALYDTWSIIYDHCEDPTKPATMEEWLKGISYNDIPHIWATIYKASFLGNSYIPFDCENPECGKPFIPGETPFEDFVKYKDDASKEYVQSVFKHGTVESNFNKPKLVQISDDLVFGITRPSIYSFVFENLGLDDEITTKYSDTIDIINYISDIFVIDRNSGQFVPVMPKKYPGNRLKTIKSKILVYTRLISTLTSDQRGYLSSSITSFLKDSTKYEVSYIYPQVECTRCHHMTEERPVNPNELVFLRHKLAALMR